ncbi:protein of unknown function [Burkholderia multivorans]
MGIRGRMPGLGRPPLDAAGFSACRLDLPPSEVARNHASAHAASDIASVWMPGLRDPRNEPFPVSRQIASFAGLHRHESRY